MNRSALVQGPSKNVFNSFTFYSKEDFEIDLKRETFKVGTNAFGDDERDADIMAEWSVVPEGRFSANAISALWPYANYKKGQGLYSDTDVPFVAHASDGELHTVIAAAVVGLPDLTFSAEKSLVGAAKFLGLRGNNMDWDDDNSLYTAAASGSTFTDTSYSNTLIKTQPYLGAISGVTGLTSFDTLDGFKTSFNLTLGTTKPDRHGTMQKTFQSLECVTTCIPIGPTRANVLAAAGVQGTGAARGRSGVARSAAFTIVGDDGVTYLTVPKAAVQQFKYRFGTKDNYLRQGEIAIVAQWNFATGAQQPLFTLAAS